MSRKPSTNIYILNLVLYYYKFIMEKTAIEKFIDNMKANAPKIKKAIEEKLLSVKEKKDEETD